MADDVRLTQYSKSAGCAAKLGPGHLEDVLSRLPEETAPELLSSIAMGEDAGVYKMSDDLVLVQTVDFFPPIVDDPYTFGQIAAANALSDIYAMNAKPLTALNLVSFPCSIDRCHLEAILLGGYDKVHEAGAIIVGGHTIEDDEPKYGLSVLGTARVDEITSLRGAAPGDALVLTKPIGTGIITTALKGRMIPVGAQEAIESMKRLNAGSAALIASAGVHAMTDVTGFGLARHLYDMLRAGGVAADLWAREVPLFTETLAMVSIGMSARTSMYDCLAEKTVEVDAAGVDELLVQCMFDPQTSGGLLAAVPAEKADGLVEALRSGPAPEAAVVGAVRASDVHRVTIRQSREG
jgi:selenide, water dikinase